MRRRDKVINGLSDEVTKSKCQENTMRIVIQRVSEASVKIAGVIKSEIGKGLLVLLGIEEADDEDDIEWLCGKIARLRIFNDADGVMNLSLSEAGGAVLLVSQFTLHASTKKGNRPGYTKAARPEVAIPLYEKFISMLQKETGGKVLTGEFGADMQVSLTNDGPVTILIDSKNRE
jgi:D-aminoacyl-tRNA deacylase